MYHPTGRVLTVLELLQSHSSLTGNEIAAKLECDLRTVRRYVCKLQDVGIPIDSTPGPGGGYRLRPGFRLPPLIFTEDEAVAILLGLVGTAWLHVALPTSAIEGTLSKIARVLPITTREKVSTITRLLVMPSDTGTMLDANLLLRLNQAASDARCVHLEYRTQETTVRIIEPYGVAGYNGQWYVVGFCRLRQAMRVFRLDRIQSALVLDDTFKRPPSFDVETFIHDGLASQRWQVCLAIRASPEDVRAHFGQLGEITRVPEGCIYRVPASDLDLLARQLLLSRLAFDVIEPQALKDTFRTLAEQARLLATG